MPHPATAPTCATVLSRFVRASECVYTAEYDLRSAQDLAHDAQLPCADTAEHAGIAAHSACAYSHGASAAVCNERGEYSNWPVRACLCVSLSVRVRECVRVSECVHSRLCAPEWVCAFMCVCARECACAQVCVYASVCAVRPVPGEASHQLQRPRAQTVVHRYQRP
jgi:hypothetical protein